MSIYCLSGQSSKKNKFIQKTVQKRLQKNLRVVTDMPFLNIFRHEKNFHYLRGLHIDIDELYTTMGLTKPFSPLVDEEIPFNDLLILYVNKTFINGLSETDFFEFLAMSRRLCWDVVFVVEDAAIFNGSCLNLLIDFSLLFEMSIPFIPTRIEYHFGRLTHAYAYSL
ncbi:hypothetical protein [Providencia rettgeri]|uniref:hypothetical protein n=1 Tax=Providencia rettgeri TaxID=587 RepID=UPI001B37758C|nr:hypothetical protein [Providencia rettgeri]MBQ0372950.1 hypothetical protein [Providencia rettgeri]